MNERTDAGDECASLSPQEFLASAFERFGVKSIADDWQRFGLVGICA
jgi:hypothetical protein